MKKSICIFFVFREMLFSVLTYHSVSLLMDPTEHRRLLLLLIQNLENPKWNQLNLIGSKLKSQRQNVETQEVAPFVRPPLDQTCLSGHAGDCLGIGECFNFSKGMFSILMTGGQDACKENIFPTKKTCQLALNNCYNCVVCLVS